MPAYLASQRDIGPRLQRLQSMSPLSRQPLAADRASLIDIPVTPLGS